MPRFKKTTTPTILLPVSDWDIEPWTQGLYKKHEADFKEIQKEYRYISSKCPSAIMARWYWLQNKGAVKIEWRWSSHAGWKYPDFIVRPDKYQKYSNMFSRYCEWTSFEERRTAEVAGISMNEIMADTTKELDNNYKARMDCFREPIDFNAKQDSFADLADEITIADIPL